MRHVLVIANQTAVGAHLTDRVLEMRSSDPDIDVFVLVPATAVRSGEVRDGRRIHDLEGIDRARTQLAAAIAAFERAGIPADGVIGDPDPMRAARGVMETRSFDTILVSTLPLGASRWISMDLPHRLRRRYHVAVEHVVGAATEPEPPQPRPVRVLLVEDQAPDVELVNQALAQLPDEVDLTVAKNGAEALAAIRTYGVHAHDLILLDLKMPVLDGHGFLEKCGQEFDMDDLNVVILTTSTNETDRERAHQLGAAAYVVKDPDFQAFCEMLDSLVSEAAPT